MFDDDFSLYQYFQQVETGGRIIIVCVFLWKDDVIPPMFRVEDATIRQK